MNQYDVIVVGAGAAGLLAAGRAAESGKKVLVLEKMRHEGRKLLITGKGRCNITNDAQLKDFLKHVHGNPRFLRTALSRFSSEKIIALLNQQGVPTVLERGGRYFPASNKSSDVLDALLRWVHSHGGEIRCGQRVDKLLIEEQVVRGVQCGLASYYTSSVILAMGGKSYPATGSNGDGYRLAQDAGHTIVTPIPALVPLETDDASVCSLQGLALKNINAMVWVEGKKLAEQFGELLFTHFGVSGPVILTLSRLVVEKLLQQQVVELSLDLKPALDEKKLDNRLLRDLNENGKKKVGNLYRTWLPSSMASVMAKSLPVDAEKVCHQVSAKERKSIVSFLKDFRFPITGYRSFKEAIITAGGVSLEEVSAKTMQSTIVSGLFFAGEMLDVDAETGGYNLQIAFSTGWLAGDACASRESVNS